MEEKRKKQLTEIVGWIAKGLFNRSVKAAETIMRNDPRFKKAVVNAAERIEKVENELQDYLDTVYGDESPEEIEKNAKIMGMSVKDYIETFHKI